MNDLTIDTAIQQIHTSDAYGSFYDLGTDMGLYKRLWMQPGASKTIAQYCAYYSKERQDDIILDSFKEIRSVSFDRIVSFFETWENSKHANEKLQKENLCFVASWQVGSSVCNHGWIGIIYKEKVGVFHVTTKPFAFGNITHNVQTERILGGANASYYHLELLNYMINDSTDVLLSGVDVAYIGTYIDKKLNLPIATNVLFNDMLDKILCYDTKKQTFIRAEEAARDLKNEFVILKGSFNPYHSGHEELVIKHNVNVLMMSTRNFDPNKLVNNNLESWVKRINMLTKESSVRYIFITDDAMFLANQSLMNKRFGSCNIKFVVGEDIADKIPEEQRKSLNLLEEPRSEESISSTKLRQLPCDCGNSYLDCTKYLTGCDKHPEQKTYI